MAEDADIERVAIDLTLGIQADILIDLASGFARINHVAAAETIRTIEEKIVRDLRERATGLRAGVSAPRVSPKWQATLPIRSRRPGRRWRRAKLH